MKYTDYDKYYDECLGALNDCRKNSESDFESKITYITAGALGVSIAIFNDYSGCDATWILLIGWWMLLISLLVNCWSAHHVKQMCTKVSKEIKEAKSNNWCKNFSKQTGRINYISNLYNYATIVLSMVGIMTIVLFTTLNFTNMTRDEGQGKATYSDNNRCEKAEVVRIQNSRGIDIPMCPLVGSGEKDDSDNKGDSQIDGAK